MTKVRPRIGGAEYFDDLTWHRLDKWQLAT